MKSYTLKLYTQADYQFVYEVKKICYQKYVEENFGKWNDDEQYEMFDAFLKTSAKDIFVIFVDDKKAGFINGDDLDENTYVQGNICLLPEFQNMGIGTSLLSQICEDHINQNISLKVFKQNPAKRLYERLGFTVTGETKSHFLMKKVQKDD